MAEFGAAKRDAAECQVAECQVAEREAVEREATPGSGCRGHFKCDERLREHPS